MYLVHVMYSFITISLDKSEVWEHLMLMYCDKMFPQPNDEEEDFRKKAKEMKTKKVRSYCFLRQRYLDDSAKWNENGQEGLRKSFEEFIGTIWGMQLQVLIGYIM